MFTPSLVAASHSDRRDSLRIPVGLWARPYDRTQFWPTQGNLSMGGARATLPGVPDDHHLEILVDLGTLGQLRLQAEMVGTVPSRHGVDVRMRFVDMTADEERTLARFLDNAIMEVRSWENLAA